MHLRILFWVQGWRRNRFSIVRASMDGSSVRTILDVNDIGLGRITRLAVDSHKIYWIFSNAGRIHRCNFDGTGRELLPLRTAVNSFVLGVFANSIYWMEWDDGEKYVVQRGSFSIMTITTVVHVTRHDLHNVIVLPEDGPLQKQSWNPCTGNRCSHLCVQSSERPEGFACMCDEGFTIHADGKNCIGSSCSSH